jgi:hypothetical protein
LLFKVRLPGVRNFYILIEFCKNEAGNTRRPSNIWQGFSAKEFSVALFAAEKDFSPPEINGSRLALGKVTLANRVLHQHLSGPVKVLGLFLPRGKGLFHNPIADSQKDYIDENAPHIF